MDHNVYTTDLVNQCLLRFVCPAVAAPDSFKLRDAPLSKEVRRRLVLVSKLLQNLANDVLFGDKEPCIGPRVSSVRFV